MTITDLPGTETADAPPHRMALPKIAGMMSAAVVALAALRIPWHPWVLHNPDWEKYSGADVFARVFYMPAFWVPLFAVAMIAAVWSGSTVIATCWGTRKLQPDIAIRNMAVFVLSVSVFGAPFVIEASTIGIGYMVTLVGEPVNSLIDSFVDSFRSEDQVSVGVAGMPVLGKI